MELLVRVSQEDIDEATEFAKKRSGDVALYEKRGGFKPSDIVNGAVAEIAVFKTLKDFFPNLTKPDFNIYEKSKKTFNADLKSDDEFFHVKGQSVTSAARYTESWLMQKFDPILKKPEVNHFLVPCVVDVDRKLVTIHACLSFADLVREKAFDECTVPSFRATKLAIRLKTLRQTFDDASLWGVLHSKGIV